MGSRAKPRSPPRKGDGEPPAKRLKADEPPKVNAPKPEDLESGTAVFFWNGQRGVIRDAYPPLDEFWIEDSNGELIRDESGDIMPFKSAELQLVAPAPQVTAPPDAEHRVQLAGVLLLGTEDHMMRVLEHFGSPNLAERHTPQQLLAIPASMCDPSELLAVAGDGVEDSVVQLARQQRPDIQVANRAYHLKQAVEQLGPEFRSLDQYYCLVAVQIPYSTKEIAEVTGYEREQREKVWNQIDLCVTATGPQEDFEVSTEATAQRVLGAQCGLAVAQELWSPEAQTALRTTNRVSMPLEYTDTTGTRVFILMLPDTAVMTTKGGILCFDASASGQGVSMPRPADPAPPVPAMVPPKVPTGASDGNRQVNGKTINEWEQEQAQFAHLPKLPDGWMRVKSRQSNEVYFFNRRTLEATFELPLPDGWTRQVSKSTGKKYYFHAKKRLSQYDRPTE